MNQVDLNLKNPDKLLRIYQEQLRVTGETNIHLLAKVQELQEEVDELKKQLEETKK